MRRKDKEISEFEQIEVILKRERVCRIALSENNIPYLVPLSYGYANKTLYFHSAPEGKKIEILRANPKLCFEIESNLEVVPNPLPCKWGMKFETVIGDGSAEFIEDLSAKLEALKIIMNQYGSTYSDNIKTEILQNTTVFKVEIQSMSGKRSGI